MLYNPRMSAWEQLAVNRPDEWRAPSTAGLICGLIFYCGFLLYAWASQAEFLFLDHVNLIIHEAGHFFFGWFGSTIGILGGTLGELLVPLLLGIYFWWHRHTSAVAFCAFWFFENFLYIGTYMADARRLTLPLVGSGEHDWEILFTQWNLLHLDQKIGGWTRGLGWLGMMLSPAWLLWMRSRFPPTEPK
ncbi:MAG TPA: hypothetical protein VNL38_02325 [Candidatus Nitrosotenuis sp.]|nr:hypothetical protein [Candidatus Nitrosotenuis sp.]